MSSTKTAPFHFLRSGPENMDKIWSFRYLGISDAYRNEMKCWSKQGSIDGKKLSLYRDISGKNYAVAGYVFCGRTAMRSGILASTK